MQRTLLICRHATTQEPFPLQPDFERALSFGGIKEAHATGQWIRENFIKIDALVASPARRTTATARILASRLYFPEEKIKFNPTLYNGHESHLLNCLGELPDEVRTVLLVAHNPGVTRLARELTSQQIAYLEPSCVAAVSLNIAHWQEIHVATGTLLEHKLERI